MLGSWVQQVCFEPPMVSVAIAKGRAIMPLISESHEFGLCQLPNDDKLILRKFAGKLDSAEDPFLSFELIHETATRAPILAHVLGYLECRLVCHMDVEGDHDLFVGNVVGGKYFGGEPELRVRDNGFKY